MEAIVRLGEWWGARVWMNGKMDLCVQQRTVCRRIANACCVGVATV